MRLIDADAVIGKYCVVKRQMQMMDNTQYADAVIGGMRKIARMIEEQPTVESKYRWHDLSKNPSDLPDDEYKDVLAYDGGYFIARCSHYTDFYGRLHTEWTDDNFGTLENVIAWRYLEPFESFEENT